MTTQTTVSLTCHHTAILDGAVEVGTKVTCTKCSDRPRTVKTAAVFTDQAEVPEQAEPVAQAEVPEVEEPQDVPDTPQAYDALLASHEWQALKTWMADGKQGDRPDTTNLDALNAAHAGGNPVQRGKAPAKLRSSTRQPSTLAEGLTFVRNDVPFKDRRFSTIAYHYTKGIDPERVRISTKELLAIFAEQGVTEVHTTEWQVTLPNGDTWACRQA